ncbi:hypothetical protein LSH36_170g03000, partial [Paralvinella palmiformis]
GEGEPPEVPMETTINIAAIVGGTIGGVVLLILITLLGLYIYWRYEPREDETDPDERPLTPVPYTVIKDDQFGGDKIHITNGVDNPTYLTEDHLHDRTDRQKVVENEYIPHPGLRRDDERNNINGYHGSQRVNDQIQVDKGWFVIIK